MKHELKKIICCGTALTAVLTAVAGCSVKDTGRDSGRKDEPAIETEAGTKPEKNEETTSKDTNMPDLSDTNPTTAELPEEGTIGDISYKLETASSDGGSDERGYYLCTTGDDEYIYGVIIAAGEFNTGGYGIKISDIQYDGTEMTIIVTETAPGPMDMVTQAFTYPCYGVVLSKMPLTVNVISDTGYEFDCLYVYIEEQEIEPGWFAVLENGAGEFLQKTYVYETVDGKYSYINVESHTKSWGSSEWVDIVKSSGIADTKEDVLDAAKNFGSDGFVLFPDDMTTAHTIDEFLED